MLNLIFFLCVCVCRELRSYVLCTLSDTTVIMAVVSA